MRARIMGPYHIIEIKQSVFEDNDRKAEALRHSTVEEWTKWLHDQVKAWQE